jgi:hypothetical protein
MVTQLIVVGDRDARQAKEVPPKISQHSAVRLYGRHDARPF